MKQVLNKKISNGLIVLSAISFYSGYSHDQSNFIPAEISYAIGITTLFFGALGHVLNLKDSNNKK